MVNTFAQVQNLDLSEITNKQNKIKTSNFESKSEIKEDIKIDADDLVHFGDLIDVDVIGSSEYDWRGKVTNEGFLDGIEFTKDEVYALCKSKDEIAQKIAESYSKFLKDPEIIVTILDRTNRPNTILYGAVVKPQQFKLKRKVSLNELIVLAGGFTEKASGTIQILRQPAASCFAKIQNEREIAELKKSGNEEFVKVSQENNSKFINVKISDLLSGNKDSNIQIFYGDLITVKVAEPIYVIGGVAVPTKFSMRENMNVTRAIAIAGGLTKKADAENITIFRRESGKTKVIKINLKEVAEQKANDVELLAYDIIDVPENGRDEKIYPPIINFGETENENISKLPVTIID